MPNGRFVSKTISTNEQLGACSLEADLLFDRCIPHLDVEGRITGNPDLLKSTVVPLRAEIPAERIPALLQELAAAVDHDGVPLVRWYEVAGQKVLAFPGFQGQQQGMKREREARSRLPGPDDPRARVLAGPELVRSESGPAPEEVRTRSPISGSGRRGIVQAEAERARANGAAPPAPLESDREEHPPADGAPGGEADPLGEPHLAALVERLRRERYGGATPERWADVRGQLAELLTAEGVRDDRGDVVRATPAILARALKAVLRERARDPDKAIVVVLRKCSSGSAVAPPDAQGRTPPEAHAADGAAERADEAAEFARAQADAAAWLAAHPNEREIVEARAARDCPGKGAIIEHARALRVVQLVAQRRAGAGELAGAAS